ncbi:hypothetical protein WR25_24258 [Diploscapter pachys]|uniref:Uncharacterized protein n=1 Tax=Diploscapter pachys TaxID=2018661 RepID=A0A2A2LJT4_9BILA|nr:hypothetical protein WR25_24258 [Diploscapter pachys]
MSDDLANSPFSSLYQLDRKRSYDDSPSANLNSVASSSSDQTETVPTKKGNFGTHHNRIPDTISLFIHTLWYTDEHVKLIIGPRDNTGRERLSAIRAEILQKANEKIKECSLDFQLTDTQLINHISNKRKFTKMKINQGFSRDALSTVDQIIYDSMKGGDWGGHGGVYYIDHSEYVSQVLEGELNRIQMSAMTNGVGGGEMRSVEKTEPVENGNDYRNANGNDGTNESSILNWDEFTRSIGDNRMMDESPNSNREVAQKLEKVEHRMDKMEKSLESIHRKVDKLFEFLASGQK